MGKGDARSGSRKEKVVNYEEGFGSGFSRALVAWETAHRTGLDALSALGASINQFAAAEKRWEEREASTKALGINVTCLDWSQRVSEEQAMSIQQAEASLKLLRSATIDLRDVAGTLSDLVEHDTTTRLCEAAGPRPPPSALTLETNLSGELFPPEFSSAGGAGGREEGLALKSEEAEEARASIARARERLEHLRVCVCSVEQEASLRSAILESLNLDSTPAQIKACEIAWKTSPFLDSKSLEAAGACLMMPPPSTAGPQTKQALAMPTSAPAALKDRSQKKKR